ncbi:MAG: hypothetical protein ACLVAT_10795 [Lachnospiraceae bacterium]
MERRDRNGKTAWLAGFAVTRRSGFRRWQTLIGDVNGESRDGWRARSSGKVADASACTQNTGKDAREEITAMQREVFVVEKERFDLVQMEESIMAAGHLAQRSMPRLCGTGRQSRLAVKI